MTAFLVSAIMETTQPNRETKTMSKTIRIAAYIAPLTYALFVIARYVIGGLPAFGAMINRVYGG